MTALVVEASVAGCASPGGRPVIVVPRARRRGAWRPVEADAAVAALDRAGEDAIVLARPAGADPGAAPVVAVARLLGHPVVRLPAGDSAAAWVVATATHPQFLGDALIRRLDVLVGVPAAVAGLPMRPSGHGPEVPALRPAVLARWAGCAWRPCAACPGGGLAGASCGRCGAGIGAPA
jgi:hypothetical protein